MKWIGFSIKIIGFRVKTVGFSIKTVGLSAFSILSSFLGNRFLHGNEGQVLCLSGLDGAGQSIFPCKRLKVGVLKTYGRCVKNLR